MEFRKINPEQPLGPPGEVSVMVEPLPGYSDDEVVSRLHGLGASSVSVLAPGFISARALSAALTGLREIADVHLKPTKQIRVGG